jgi:hypothetical protein
MDVVHNESIHGPTARARRLAFEAGRRAQAMGLVDADTASRDDLKTVRQIASQARKAGIASEASAALHNIDAPTGDELASLLQMLIAALEASPVPRFEWGGLSRVLGPDELGALVNVSASSLKRYQSGERDTPDGVAARLHHVALIVSDLAGSYNDIGIRRWFHRKRTLLDGRAPVELLRGDWEPEDPGPQRVREVARQLVALSAS